MLVFHAEQAQPIAFARHRPQAAPRSTFRSRLTEFDYPISMEGKSWTRAWAFVKGTPSENLQTLEAYWFDGC